MRFSPQTDGNGKVSGYVMRLSAADTSDWASKPSGAWPCSTMACHAIMVCVDDNGLCDYSGPDDADGNELDAIVSDYLPTKARHLWPVWGQSDG